MTDSAVRAEEIKVLTVDGTTYVVSDLSQNVQRLVQIYNHWRQQQVDARLELSKIDAALRSLSNEIVLAMQKEQEEATAEGAPQEEVADSPSV